MKIGNHQNRFEYLESKPLSKREIRAYERQQAERREALADLDDDLSELYDMPNDQELASLIQFNNATDQIEIGEVDNTAEVVATQEFQTQDVAVETLSPLEIDGEFTFAAFQGKTMAYFDSRGTERWTEILNRQGDSVFQGKISEFTNAVSDLSQEDMISIFGSDDQAKAYFYEVLQVLIEEDTTGVVLDMIHNKPPLRVGLAFYTRCGDSAPLSERLVLLDQLLPRHNHEVASR